MSVQSQFSVCREIRGSHLTVHEAGCLGPGSWGPEIDGIIHLKLTSPEMKACYSSTAEYQAAKRGACCHMHGWQGVRGYTAILQDVGTVGQNQGVDSDNAEVFSDSDLRLQL